MIIKTIIKKSTYSFLGLLITSHAFANDGEFIQPKAGNDSPRIEKISTNELNLNSNKEFLDKNINDFEEKLARMKRHGKSKSSKAKKETLQQQQTQRTRRNVDFPKKQEEMKEEHFQDLKETDETLDKLINDFEKKLDKAKTQKKKHIPLHSFESKLKPQDWENIKSDFFFNDTYTGYQIVDSYNNLAPLIITDIKQQDANEPISVDINAYVKDTNKATNLIIGRTYAWENNSQSVHYNSNGHKYKINFKLQLLRHYPKIDTNGILIPAKPTQLSIKTALQEKFKELLDAQQKVMFDFKKEVIDPVCEDETYNVLFQKCFGEISTDEAIFQPQENEQLHRKTKDIQRKQLPLDKETQRRPRVKKTERQQTLQAQLQ